MLDVVAQENEAAKNGGVFAMTISMAQAIMSKVGVEENSASAKSLEQLGLHPCCIR